MAPDPRHEIAARFRESRRIAVTSHLRPDGDSLCTALALSLMGDLLGKTVEVINKDNTPFPFVHFPDSGRIRIGQIDPDLFDTVILLECADVSRSGQEHLDKAFKINIDHHYSNTPYARINWIRPEASAVGEMVFELSHYLNITLTPEIANHLYCAIVSDTGSFQFSNTTAKALEACTSLAKLGASPIRVSELLFNNNLPEKIKLLGRVLSDNPTWSLFGLSANPGFERHFGARAARNRKLYNGNLRCYFYQYFGPLPRKDAAGPEQEEGSR